MYNPRLLPDCLESDELKRSLDVYRALPAIDPKVLMPLARKSLQINEMRARHDACKNLVGYEASIVAEWLNNRHSHERNIRVDVCATSRQTGLFGKGESLRVTTQVNIW